MAQIFTDRNCSFFLPSAQFSGFGGLTSGIPTRTTATLTPTTLKNIEESFLELQSVPPAPMEHQHQAGFVPPVVNIAQYQQQQQQHHSNSLGQGSPCVVVKQEVEEDWLPACTQQQQMQIMTVHCGNSGGSAGNSGNDGSRHSSGGATASPPVQEKSKRSGGGRRPNRSEKVWISRRFSLWGRVSCLWYGGKAANFAR